MRKEMKPEEIVGISIITIMIVIIVFSISQAKFLLDYCHEEGYDGVQNIDPLLATDFNCFNNSGKESEPFNYFELIEKYKEGE